ncbi:unnamed protein product [Enterobius vermicularis]|uniref:BPTI/Kunitz inhibitor domain-containing protein n=1 Tax=Enterobius vermicularis TaxID=51028 RepID=A0A3P6IPB7_ENTVE|nr:unnamed protein product [Enterobius vermicularis]
MNFNATFSVIVQVPCKRSEDCPNDKWFCSADNNLCHCKRNFVQIGQDCWTKIKINENECYYDRQCTATWPTARCIDRRCRCPPPSVAVATSTGIVCTVPGECPIGGSQSILPQSWGCHNRGECGQQGRLNHLYDCITPSWTVSYCCPNRANTCMQPLMPGNGTGRFLKYYYDSNIRQCLPFMYRGGKLSNANVFQSKADCNIYCRLECPRGNPERLGSGDYILCDNDSVCGTNYGCFKKQSADTGICCPKREWVCSANGAREHFISHPIEDDFDSGYFLHPSTSVYVPVIRFYYSIKEHRCKAFLYKGIGGNFNHFLTMDHCQRFCSKDTVIRANGSLNDAKLIEPLKAGIPNDVSIVTSTVSATTAVTDYTFNDYKLNSNIEVTPKIYLPTTEAAHSQPASCPGNRVPQYDSRGKVVLCSYDLTIPNEESSPCDPKGLYTCAFFSVGKTSGICCSSLSVDQHRCPAGYVSLIGLEQKPVRCSPMEMTSCIAHSSICVFDEFYGSYHCCRKAAFQNELFRLTAPPTDLLSTPLEEILRKTFPLLENATTQNWSYGKIPPQENNFGCPSAEAYFEDPIVGGVLECDPLNNTTCPPDCPLNSAAYVNLKKNLPLGCDSRRGCPTSFFCYRNPSRRTDNGACCSEDPLTSLCSHGVALRDVDGKAVKCKHGDTCPAGYSCLNKYNINICCPTSEQVCSQPPHKGSICGDIVQQIGYYFDPHTKKCKEFVFSGCGGNDNRFETVSDCMEFCRPGLYCPIGFPLVEKSGYLVNCSEAKQCMAGYECMVAGSGNYCCPKLVCYYWRILEMVCSLPKNEGKNCTPYKEAAAKVTLWHFSAADQQCQKFSYLGCNGNINRFATEQQCSNTCFAALCSIGTVYMVNYSLVHCMKELDCPTGYLCMPSRYGRSALNGCTVNYRVLETLCTRTVENDKKECAVSIYRYQYEAKQDQCVSVLQSACSSDTTTTFDKMSDCKRFCVRKYSVCPSSELIYYSGHWQKALTCSPIIESCPPGHYCSSFSLSSSFRTCCPYPKCRSGKDALKYDNGTVVKCSVRGPEIFPHCPSNYKCQMVQDGQYFCCPQAEISEVCPPDSRPYVKLNSLPALCAEKEPRCPEGYTCYDNKKYFESYCCSDGSAPVEPLNPYGRPNGNLLLNYHHLCVDGNEPLSDLLGVKICHLALAYSCPKNYHCEYNRYLDRNQCCPNANSVPVTTRRSYLFIC